MNKVLIGTYFCILCNAIMAQNVSNVSVEQIGQNLVVSYDLDKTATISVRYSTDGGKTYSAPLKHVTGDVGKNVTAGHKAIRWDVLGEVNNLVCNDLVFLVTVEKDNISFNVYGVAFEMVYVEGGTFTMGATNDQVNEADNDEKPAHLVTLSDYYIGQYEVTQTLWKAVMNSNPSFSKGNNKPVENISWSDCQTFINKLNSLLSSQLGGKRFALPTEAQWEYAARGGKKSQGYKYAGSNNIDAVAWYEDNSAKKTHIVGEKQPNELGLYDMSGNVWEWCQDWYGQYSSDSQLNPIGVSSGSYRVLRGGSCRSNQWDCRTSVRYNNNPNESYVDVGLRLVIIP